MKSVLLGEQNGLGGKGTSTLATTSWVSNPLSRPRQPQEGRACTGAFLMLLSGRGEEGARLGGGATEDGEDGSGGDDNPTGEAEAEAECANPDCPQR